MNDNQLPDSGLLQRFPEPSCDFFPADTLDFQPELHKFRERVYASHLTAMNERPLFPASLGDADIYRLLYIPTFEGSIVVRMIRSQGAWQAVFKQCDGEAGFGPGNLISETCRPLSSVESQKFESLIESSQFWDMTSCEESDGLDGSQVILEGVRGGTYHIVDRWSPRETTYAQLALFMLGISRGWVQKLLEAWSSAVL